MNGALNISTAAAPAQADSLFLCRLVPESRSACKFATELYVRFEIGGTCISRPAALRAPFLQEIMIEWDPSVRRA